MLSLPCSSSVPNLFPSSRNTSLSLCIFHVFLCFAFPPAAFHFFSPSFFTQETISLSLATLQQNQAKLFYTNDLQHRNACSKSMCSHDLVMKKKKKLTSKETVRSLGSPWYLGLSAFSSHLFNVASASETLLNQHKCLSFSKSC